MEEEIEVIADIATETPDIKYIKTSDGKVHKIFDTRDTTGSMSDGNQPAAFYLVGAINRGVYSQTNTNENIWWENNYDRQRTILHSEGIALGPLNKNGTYPIEINCEGNATQYLIRTVGRIITGGITADGISRFGSLVVNNDSISEADANGKIIVGDNIIINSINKVITVGSITLDGETGGVLIGRNIALTSDGSITANGSITAGTVTANAFYQDSDERLKTFTEDYDINLDNIKNIKTGKFYWNADDTQTLNGGVSAQTVEEYFPELVRENEEGIKTVNYDGLAVVAIAAIKKLTERIEQLEEIVRSK
jgi:hypothetical protein